MNRVRVLVLAGIAAVLFGGAGWIAAGRLEPDRGSAVLPGVVPAAARRVVADVSFEDGGGRALKLSAFRGKVVLLNIWATWCPPCRAEMPMLDRLQAKLGGPDFEVVALSIDSAGASAVRAFYAQNGIRHLRVVVDPGGSVGSALGSAVVPTTLLLDREGRVAFRKLGPAEWDGAASMARIRAVIGEPSRAPARAGSEEARHG